jgi:hypothetical protein
MNSPPFLEGQDMASREYLLSHLEALLASRKALWTITDDAEREHVRLMLDKEIEEVRERIRALPPLAITANEG